MEKSNKPGKRRRISSSSDDGKDSVWNDSSLISPTLLEEMGLSVLDESSEEILSDEKSDDCENVLDENNTKVKHISKKSKVASREPLRFITPQCFPFNKNYCENRSNLDAINGSDCTIKNSKIMYTNLNNDEEKKNQRNSLENELNLKRPLRRSPVIKGEDHLSRLPEEVLLYTMKMLDRKSIISCANVSKLFRRVAYDEALWCRMDLSAKFLQSGALGYLLPRGTWILRLAQTSFSEPIFLPQQLPNNYTSDLQYLDLSMATISTVALTSILSVCKRLKKLSLEHCPVNDSVCKEIGENPSLEVLNLTMCTGLTEHGLSRIFKSCKRIISLNIGWTGLSIPALDAVTVEIHDSIERLNISGCRRNLLDHHVIKILARCSKLRELDVSDSVLLTDDIIDHIIENGQELEHLAMSRCYSIPLQSLTRLTKAVNLEYLEIFGLAKDDEIKSLDGGLTSQININQFPFSSIARPTVGLRRTSIWGVRVRD